MLLGNVVKTDLYVKHTDKHQYLLKSSCHPSHTKQSIPFSMALRLRRICSTDEFLNTRSDALTSHLIKRGYISVSLKTKSRKYAKFHAVEPSKHPLRKSPTEFHLQLHLIQPYQTYVKSFPVTSIFFALHNVAKQHSLLPLSYHTTDATTYAIY